MNPFGRAKLKSQISNYNVRLSAGLFGGNDQAELGSIKLSSMTQISFF
jgi:hypothetical protein